MKPIDYRGDTVTTEATESTPTKTPAKKSPAKKSVAKKAASKEPKTERTAVSTGTEMQEIHAAINGSPESSPRKRAAKKTAAPADGAKKPQTLAQLERAAEQAVIRFKTAKEKAKLTDARRSVSSLKAVIKNGERELEANKKLLDKAEQALAKLEGPGE